MYSLPMISITIKIDPLIYDALKEFSAVSHYNRAQTIRDALYTALWNYQRHGIKLRRALDCPPNMHGQNYRLKSSGRVVEIDLWGLEINDAMRRNPHIEPDEL
jgi:hypothetical protein